MTKKVHIIYSRLLTDVENNFIRFQIKLQRAKVKIKLPRTATVAKKLNQTGESFSKCYVESFKIFIRTYLLLFFRESKSSSSDKKSTSAKDGEFFK